MKSIKNKTEVLKEYLYTGNDIYNSDWKNRDICSHILDEYGEINLSKKSLGRHLSELKKEGVLEEAQTSHCAHKDYPHPVYRLVPREETDNVLETRQALKALSEKALSKFKQKKDKKKTSTQGGERMEKEQGLNKEDRKRIREEVEECKDKQGLAVHKASKHRDSEEKEKEERIEKAKKKTKDLKKAKEMADRIIEKAEKRAKKEETMTVELTRSETKEIIFKENVDILAKKVLEKLL